jgi:hypothetical protein
MRGRSGSVTRRVYEGGHLDDGRNGHGRAAPGCEAVDFVLDMAQRAAWGLMPIAQVIAAHIREGTAG